MAIRMTFPQKNELSGVIVNKPAPPPKLTSLDMFKQMERNYNNDQDKQRLKKVEEILQDLDALIGLVEVKKLILEIQAFVEIRKRREKEKLVTEPLVLHSIFRGNPGSGKTTVARLVARLFKEMGILEKGHVIEVERADLVGEYIGHTAHKTREQLKRAVGGVLFIDEAYSLARGGDKDFGKEAIDTMVRNMEEYKDNLILILAGYKQEMTWFLETNPGLRSRFPIQIDFPDYTVPELMEIADLMLKKRQYQLAEDARIEMENILQQVMKRGHEHSGNARLVRNLIEKAIRLQAVRLLEAKTWTKNELILITKEDLCQAGKAILETRGHTTPEFNNR